MCNLIPDQTILIYIGNIIFLITLIVILLYTKQIHNVNYNVDIDLNLNFTNLLNRFKKICIK